MAERKEADSAGAGGSAAQPKAEEEEEEVQTNIALLRHGLGLLADASLSDEGCRYVSESLTRELLRTSEPDLELLFEKDWFYDLWEEFLTNLPTLQSEKNIASLEAACVLADQRRNAGKSVDVPLVISSAVTFLRALSPTAWCPNTTILRIVRILSALLPWGDELNGSHDVLVCFALRNTKAVSILTMSFEELRVHYRQQVSLGLFLALTQRPSSVRPLQPSTLALVVHGAAMLVCCHDGNLFLDSRTVENDLMLPSLVLHNVGPDVVRAIISADTSGTTKQLFKKASEKLAANLANMPQVPVTAAGFDAVAAYLVLATQLSLAESLPMRGVDPNLLKLVQRVTPSDAAWRVADKKTLEMEAYQKMVSHWKTYVNEVAQGFDRFARPYVVFRMFDFLPGSNGTVPLTFLASIVDDWDISAQPTTCLGCFLEVLPELLVAFAGGRYNGELPEEETAKTRKFVTELGRLALKAPVDLFRICQAIVSEFTAGGQVVRPTSEADAFVLAWAFETMADSNLEGAVKSNYVPLSTLVAMKNLLAAVERGTFSLLLAKQVGTAAIAFATHLKTNTQFGFHATPRSPRADEGVTPAAFDIRRHRNTEAELIQALMDSAEAGSHGPAAAAGAGGTGGAGGAGVATSTHAASKSSSGPPSVLASPTMLSLASPLPSNASADSPPPLASLKRSPSSVGAGGTGGSSPRVAHVETQRVASEAAMGEVKRKRNVSALASSDDDDELYSESGDDSDDEDSASDYGVVRCFTMPPGSGAAAAAAAAAGAEPMQLVAPDVSFDGACIFGSGCDASQQPQNWVTTQALANAAGVDKQVLVGRIRRTIKRHGASNAVVKNLVWKVSGDVVLTLNHQHKLSSKLATIFLSESGARVLCPEFNIALFPLALGAVMPAGWGAADFRAAAGAGAGGTGDGNETESEDEGDPAYKPSGSRPHKRSRSSILPVKASAYKRCAGLVGVLSKGERGQQTEPMLWVASTTIQSTEGLPPLAYRSFMDSLRTIAEASNDGSSLRWKVTDPVLLQKLREAGVISLHASNVTLISKAGLARCTQRCFPEFDMDKFPTDHVVAIDLPSSDVTAMEELCAAAAEAAADGGAAGGANV